VNAINPPNIIKTIVPIVDFALGLAADFEVVKELGFPVVVALPVGVVLPVGVPVAVVFAAVVKLSNFVSSVSQSCSHIV
jgi:hypothetical protein